MNKKEQIKIKGGIPPGCVTAIYDLSTGKYCAEGYSYNPRRNICCPITNRS